LSIGWAFHDGAAGCYHYGAEPYPVEERQGWLLEFFKSAAHILGPMAKRPPATAGFKT